MQTTQPGEHWHFDRLGRPGVHDRQPGIFQDHFYRDCASDVVPTTLGRDHCRGEVDRRVKVRFARKVHARAGGGGGGSHDERTENHSWADVGGEGATIQELAPRAAPQYMGPRYASVALPDAVQRS